MYLKYKTLSYTRSIKKLPVVVNREDQISRLELVLTHGVRLGPWAILRKNFKYRIWPTLRIYLWLHKELEWLYLKIGHFGYFGVGLV